MFLNKLNLDQKNAFLQIAKHVAHSDGLFSEEESAMIEQYCHEMDIKDAEYSKDFDLKAMLKLFQSDRSRRILLLELYGLIYSDADFAEEEGQIVDIILSEFELSKHLGVIYAEWAKAALSVYVQGNALIEL